MNARDTTGSTPLHIAASFGKHVAITVLLAAGADADARNEYGETPMHDAAETASQWNKPTLMDAFSEQAVAAYKAKRDKARAEANAREIEEQMRSARIVVRAMEHGRLLHHRRAGRDRRLRAIRKPRGQE